jgi:hypothetical protein
LPVKATDAIDVSGGFVLLRDGLNLWLMLLDSGHLRIRPKYIGHLRAVLSALGIGMFVCSGYVYRLQGKFNPTNNFNILSFLLVCCRIISSFGNPKISE